MRIDRRMFVLFTLMLAALTAVAVYQIFFSLPECPDGGDTCMKREAHWEGSKLFGAIFVWTWALTVLWRVISTRIVDRGGSRMWLLPFWLMAIPILLGGGFYFAVLLYGTLFV